jgi:hypothetical protein
VREVAVVSSDLDANFSLTKREEFDPEERLCAGFEE